MMTNYRTAVNNYLTTVATFLAVFSLLVLTGCRKPVYEPDGSSTNPAGDEQLEQPDNAASGAGERDAVEPAAADQGAAAPAEPNKGAESGLGVDVDLGNNGVNVDVGENGVDVNVGKEGVDVNVGDDGVDVQVGGEQGDGEKENNP